VPLAPAALVAGRIVPANCFLVSASAAMAALCIENVKDMSGSPDSLVHLTCCFVTLVRQGEKVLVGGTGFPRDDQFGWLS
jgi:hypothetical protein